MGDAEEQAGAAVEPKANCLMSRVFFFPSFSSSLSNVWDFEDGNVILRAIFKFSGIDKVLRMNSIKFTLNVFLKKSKPSFKLQRLKTTWDNL